MDEIGKYWRDNVTKLLAWGTTILGLVGGTAIYHSHDFSLLRGGDREHIRSWILLAFAFGFTIAWFRGVRWIYLTHLAGEVDATVLPWKAVRAYLWAVCSCMWVLAITAAIP
ncbi:hypothetical protein [Roseateles flavus]|uniref:Uncharacterized protein n=1 Tax=Roseateles flavus TaxID=3149041 RepID=A0ABV0GKL9_9BURK